MNPQKKNIDEFLETYIPSPSLEDMEADGARVLHRLKSERPNTPSGNSSSTDSLMNVSRAWWQLGRLPLAAGLAMFAVLSVLFIRNLVAPDNVCATIETADGAIYRMSGAQPSAIQSGERITSGELIRSEKGGATLVLADDSRVEMGSRSEFSLERADDGLRISLARGSVIVDAAKQRAGHLYVLTSDVLVSVVGTVFLVSAQEAGSRIAVIEGKVHIKQGATERSLLSGEQLSTNPLMELLSVTEEIGWSRSLKTYVALLQQSSGASTGTAKKLEFEVASIKPEAPIDRRVQVPGGGYPACRGVDGVIGESALAVQGRCTGGYVSLQWLIAVAYGLEPSSTASDRIVGLEPWMTNLWNNGFQIAAKAENPASVTKAELRQMLQALLADRFKLKATRETREYPGYVLSVGKSGTNLQKAANEEGLTQTQKVVGGNLQVTVTGTGTMSAFAEMFDPYPVFDRTNLQGFYSFNFTYIIPSDLLAPPAAQAGGQRGVGPAPGTSARFLALQSALRDQLGLQLEHTNVPTEFIIVEHAEKPSDN